MVDKEITQMRPKRPKRADAAAREATEHAKQYGVCMIPIKMSTLFAGKIIFVYLSMWIKKRFFGVQFYVFFTKMCIYGVGLVFAVLCHVILFLFIVSDIARH